MLLNVITLKNVYFATIGISIMGLSFKNLFLMVVMVCWYCVLIWMILLLPLIVKNFDYCCVVYGISKSDLRDLLLNSVLVDRGYLQNEYQGNQFL